MTYAMRQYTLTAPPDSLATGSRVMAIGKFDGLHVAHQAVLRQAVLRGEEGIGEPCLFAFTPHPRFALTGDQAYSRWLTPSAERALLAAQYGVAESYVAQFDQAFQAQTAASFVLSYLVPLGVRHIVVGYDFRFGKGGAYTTADLSAIARMNGIGCDVVEHIDVGGAPVSSSRIREALARGDMHETCLLLGRPYQWRATVIKGDQRGRTIGYPTANLDLVEPFVLPAHGVYAVDCVLVDGSVHRGMLNIGVRPTVKVAGAVSMEVHLLDFSGDLYEKEIVVRFRKWLRPEKRFSSLDALKEQLAIDATMSAEV